MLSGTAWTDPRNPIEDGRRWMIEIAGEIGQVIHRVSLET
jgi:hypothetical protein